MNCLDSKMAGIRKRITEEDKLAFFSCFLMGLFCHFFVFTGHYPAYSGLNIFINSPSVQIIEGRALAAILMALDGNVTLPFIIGIISQVIYALANVVTIRIFKVKSKTAIILVSAAFICFPVVAAMNYFLYMAECYAAAAFFASLGVLLWKNGSKLINNVGAVICFTSCLFLYQAEFSIALVLTTFVVVFELLDGTEIKVIFAMGLRALALLLVSLALYFIGFKLYMHVAYLLFGVVSYRNFSLSFSSIIEGIKQSYFAANWFWNTGTFLSRPLGRVIVFYTVCMSLYLGLFRIWTGYLSDKHRRRNGIFAILIICTLIIVYPIVSNYTFVVVPHEDRTYRQFLAHTYAFVLPVLLCERYGESISYTAEACTRKMRKYIYMRPLLVLAMSIVTIGFFCIISNTAYMNSYMQYEREHSLATRIVDRVESTEGYYIGMPVVLVLEDGYDTYQGQTSNLLEEYIPGMEQSGYGIMATSAGIKNFVDEFIHTSINFVEEDVSQEVLKDLDAFPSNKCVKIQNDTLYIRIT